MYYSAIGSLAILVLLIVNRDVLHKSKVYDKPAWIVYRRFLFAVLAYYVTDVLWGILEHKKLSSALFIDTTVYFIAMAIGLYFWAEYTVAYLNENSFFARALVYSGRVMVVLIIVMTVVNIFKPILFTVDSNSVYKALPLRYVILVFQILFLLIISFHALTYMFHTGFRSDKNRRFRILALFGIIMAVFLFTQLWFPYLPLYSIAYMLGTCLLHSFIANDEKENYEKELQEAEKIAELKNRLFSVLDNMPGMTFTKDAQTGKYLACNQAFAEYAHKGSPDKVVGLTDTQIFDAETASKFIEDDRIALSLSKPYIFYEDVLDAHGQPRQLQTTKLKYKDISGRACVLGMCQDITDLVSVQHEQAITKEAYENAVNTGLMYNNIALTLARDYSEMFYVNTDSEEFTEHRKEEGSDSFSQVRHGWHFFSDCKTELSEGAYPDDKEAFLSALNRKKLMKALAHKDTFVLTYRRMVSGEPVYFSMKISRMYKDEHYIIIGFMNVDAEIREAIAKKETLSDALSSVEIANRNRATFLAGMSQVVRSPINAIIGLDALALKSQSIDRKSREFLKRIGENAHSLLALINNILEISRIESGKEILNRSEFSLNDLIEQINGLAEPLCRGKEISFSADILGKKDERFFGDDVKLKDVLVNILNDAVNSSELSGNITLTAEKTAETNNKASLRFRIKSDGLFADSEEVSRILNDSAMAYNSNTSELNSNALNLMLTKKIVDMMDGSVSVDTQKGVGTVFTVTVSLDKSGRKDKDRIGELDIDALRILIIDDNIIEAEHAATVLEEAGIHAEFCTSGAEALQKMELQHTAKLPYNLVLTEWNMAGMNGMDISAEIHRLYEKECIVVALTAYSWDDIRKEANSVGVEEHLEKPLSGANIVDEIKRIVHHSDSAIFMANKKARLEGHRILLAEDVQINAKIMTDMLETENIKVDHAENGKIAVELFKNSTSGIYSAILMDVRMPQMDGLEAAKAIRSMDREDAKRIPIIALTDATFGEDVQLSMQAGMDTHLNKPVEAEHLIRLLGELIYESEEKLTAL